MTIKQLIETEEKDKENARRFELLGLMAEQLTDAAQTGDGMLSKEVYVEEGHALFI
jgi:hypothetical protein